jgi:hypothetical protein
MSAVDEPLPRWMKVTVGGLILAALSLLIVLVIFDEESPEAANWRVDPSASLGPADRVIPIIVNERHCASGQSADGRIVVGISYTPDEVHLDVEVRPRGGGQDCPGNPDTPHGVQLREALGEREVTGKDRPEP